MGDMRACPRKFCPSHHQFSYREVPQSPRWDAQ
jgi:hypothetical protein